MASGLWALLLSWLMAGCVPPAAYGLLTDGVLPAAGEHEVEVAVGGAPVPPVAAVQLGGQRGVGERSALAASGLAVAWPLLEFAAFDLELRRRLVADAEAPLQVTALGGVGGYRGAVGPHLGVVVSHGIGDRWRPYGGAVVEFVFLPGSLQEGEFAQWAGYASPALGARWRGDGPWQFGGEVIAIGVVAGEAMWRGFSWDEETEPTLKRMEPGLLFAGATTLTWVPGRQL